MLKLTSVLTEEINANDFSVKANGNEADLIAVRVSAAPINRFWPGHQRDKSQTELSSLLTFESDEPVELSVDVKFPINNVTIRPQSKGVKYTVNDQTITFSLETVGQYVVEVNDAHHVLHIFFDPIDNFVQTKENGHTFIRYGAGFHHIGAVELMDNTTVYLERGAVVSGAFYALGAKNIKILGYGIIDGGFEEREDDNMLLVQDFIRWGNNWQKDQLISSNPEEIQQLKKITIPGVYGSDLFVDRESFLKWIKITKPLYSGSHFYSCEKVEIRGVTYRDSAGLTTTFANCSDVTVENIKHIGMWRYNSDGIDFYNCRNCVVRNCFMRNFDDCLCVKGQVGFDLYSSENILIENCVVWCDWGKSLEVGVDTVAPEIKNIIFRNCDCIHHHTKVLDVMCEDRSKIHDVLFSDIRIEYSAYDTLQQGQGREEDVYHQTDVDHPFIYVSLGNSCWSDDGIIGSVSGIRFEKISVVCDEGIKLPSVEINGLDSENIVDDIILSDITVNGSALAEKNVIKNDYVGNVILKNS